ncbi:Uma2 family endonuclease [Botrimarina sp.]|uniref:Uma2 family endonuclease n=1 Tax=Botrimarina sp. TaxID=2795802 RepID=UPI0032EABEB7
MASASLPPTIEWTVADLAERFGPDMPLVRIVRDPRPGTATVEDVVRLDDHEDRLCELIDGVLLEKTMGFWEAYLASRLVTILGAFVGAHRVGIAAGADGMLQLFPGQVRIPDVSFVSWARLEGSGFPDEAAPLFAPDLAVEVLSRSNTKREMERKLREYFEAGTRLVWYIDPPTKTVIVYTAPDSPSVLTEQDTLTGGDVLSGLEIDLRALFATPQPPAKG